MNIPKRGLKNNKTVAQKSSNEPSKKPIPYANIINISSITEQLSIKMLCIGQIVIIGIAIALSSWNKSFTIFFHGFTRRDIALTFAFTAPSVFWVVFFFSSIGKSFLFIKKSIQAQLTGPEGRVLKSNLLVVTLFFIAAGAFGEETLARGFFQEHFGLLVSALFSAGMGFINLPLFFVMTGLSLCEGTLYILTRHNLITPIVTHIIFNGIGLFFLKKELEKEQVKNRD